MTIDPRSVAVEGVGGTPLAVATLGYIGSESGVVVQTSGVASAEAFGASVLFSTIFNLGLNSTEAHGSNGTTCEIANNGCASDEAFGSSGARVTLFTTGVPSDELFGSGAAGVTVNSIGLGSDEAFGASVASYERTITQYAGISSAEAFGLSSVTRPSTGETANERPFATRRRGGSSNASSHGPRWDVTVSAEMLTRAGKAISESEANPVKGAVKKRVDADGRIVVKARKFEGPVKSETQSLPVVVVQAHLLSVNMLDESSAIIVSGERISKVA